MKVTFSLLTLLLLIAIVALGAALYTSNTKLAQTESQLGDLFEQSGLINIEDDDRVYFRELPKQGLLTFPYQIAIPENRTFMLKVGIGPQDDMETILSHPLNGPQEGNPLLGQQGMFSVFVIPTQFGLDVGVIAPMSFKRESCSNERIEVDWLVGLQGRSVTNLPPGHPFEVQSFDVGSDSVVFSVDENDREVRMMMDRSMRNAPPVANPRTFKIWLEPADN